MRTTWLAAVLVAGLAGSVAADPLALPNTVPRTKLSKKDNNNVALPKHGARLHTWSIGGESMITFDADAKTVVGWETEMGKDKPKTTKHKLSAKQVAALAKQMRAAWNLDPIPKTPTATDIRQDLTLVDGDNAWVLSGYPITIDADVYNNAIGAAVLALYAADP